MRSRGLYFIVLEAVASSAEVEGRDDEEEDDMDDAHVESVQVLVLLLLAAVS